MGFSSPTEMASSRDEVETRWRKLRAVMG